MRENIVNRTRYWIFSFIIIKKIIIFIIYSIRKIQVKTRFLDINSQAIIKQNQIWWAILKQYSILWSLIKLPQRLFIRSNLRLNEKKKAILPPFYSEDRIKSNQYEFCNFGSQNFNQWLAGLLDADGYIYYNSKLNIITIEITMATQDILALKAIKERYGGSINKRTGSQSYRWRISSRKNIIKILQSINGDLQNPVRIAQFNQACQVLNLTLRPMRDISWNKAWLTGFFDGDGTIVLLKRPIKNSIGCRGIQISFFQKDKFLLEKLQNLIGGSLCFDKSSPGWKLSISSRTQILYLYSYFQRFPSLTSKNNRLQLIPEIYQLQDNKKASFEDWELIYKKYYGTQSK